MMRGRLEIAESLALPKTRGRPKEIEEICLDALLGIVFGKLVVRGILLGLLLYVKSLSGSPIKGIWDTRYGRTRVRHRE